MQQKIPEYFSRGEFPALNTPRIPMDAAKEGAGMAKFGEGLSALGEGVHKVATKLEQGEALNYVIDSMTKSSQSYDEYDSQARLQATEGARGFTAGAADWWDKTIQEAERTAPSMEAKLAAKKHLSMLRIRAVSAAQNFEAVKRLEYFGGNLKNSLDASYTQAYRNPEMADEIMGVSAGAIRAAAHPDTAWLDPDKAAELERGHKEKLYTSAYQGLTELDPARAVDEIKSGAWDSRLSKDSIIRLQSHAESVLEHRGRLNLSMLNQSMKDNLISIQNTGQGIPGLMQRVYGLQKPEVAAAYGKDVARAQNYFNVVQDISFKPYGEARAKIEEHLPMPGTEGYEDNLRVYNDLSLFLDKREKALRDDPANYALRAPGVKTYDAIVAQQDALGIAEQDRRLLPNTTAAKLVSEFNAAPADRRVQMIYSWKKEAGQHWPVLLRDLVRQKMAPENEILVAVHDLPWAATVVPVISEAIKQGEHELKKTLSADAVKRVDEAVREEMVDWRGSIMKGDHTGARVTWANGIQQAVTLTAFVYAQRGIDPKEAGRRAVKEIITDQYHPIDSNYRVPVGIDADKVKEYALKELSDLKSADFIPHGTARESLTPEQVKDDFLKAVQRQGYWATNEDESGLVLMDPLGLPVMVRDKSGSVRRYEFRFDAAEKYKPTEGIGPLRHMNMEMDSFWRDVTKGIDSPHLNTVYAAARQYGVDPGLALAVHGMEWDPKNNVSPKGAIGAMGLMPGTAADMGVNPNDPVQNVYGGVRYLSMLLERYKGRSDNQARALVGYNWGPRHADKWNGRMESLPAETRNYVKTILGLA